MKNTCQCMEGMQSTTGLAGIYDAEMIGKCAVIINTLLESLMKPYVVVSQLTMTVNVPTIPDNFMAQLS